MPNWAHLSAVSEPTWSCLTPIHSSPFEIFVPRGGPSATAESTTPQRSGKVSAFSPDTAVDQHCMTSETRAVAHDVLLKIYRDVVKTRIFEARVVSLNRQGKISIYATSEGEEAIAVAAAAAMGEHDWLFPDYRSSGALFARGVSMAAYMSQLLGTGRDLSKGRQMPTHYASRELKIASVSTPVGNGIAH